jgi:hypothetical protein
MYKLILLKYFLQSLRQGWEFILMELFQSELCTTLPCKKMSVVQSVVSNEFGCGVLTMFRVLKIVCSKSKYG